MTSKEPAAAAALAKKLRLGSDAGVALWPDASRFPEILGAVREAGLPEATALLAFVDAPGRVDALFEEAGEALPGIRVAWLVYPKGNVVPLNRDTIRRQLLGKGWRPVSNVAYSAELSALRMRPLEDGEAAASP